MTAVHNYGVRLVIVLGHTRCGMVARAIQQWARKEHRRAEESVSAVPFQVWSPHLQGLMPYHDTCSTYAYD
jgi:carbonic anhydrase